MKTLESGTPANKEDRDRYDWSEKIACDRWLPNKKYMSNEMQWKRLLEDIDLIAKKYPQLFDI